MASFCLSGLQCMVEMVVLILSLEHFRTPNPMYFSAFWSNASCFTLRYVSVWVVNQARHRPHSVSLHKDGSTQEYRNDFHFSMFGLNQACMPCRGDARQRALCSVRRRHPPPVCLPRSSQFRQLWLEGCGACMQLSKAPRCGQIWKHRRTAPFCSSPLMH
jgi:hypothetical protein